MKTILDATPLSGTLKEFQPLDIRIVNQTEFEPTWDLMVRHYHYLGYDKMIGPRIKYLVFQKGVPIAALSYNRAALRIGVRDRFIDWNDEQKQKYLSHVVNNNRFLILPWVKIRNLASHLLSRTLKMVRTDWYSMYGIEPYIVETFVDQEKYKGTCYKAANWYYLGETKGFAKEGQTFVYHGHRKGVYIYLLNQGFLDAIQSDPCHQTLKKLSERVPNMMLQRPDWNPKILAQAGITDEVVAGLGNLLEEYLACYSSCYARSEQRIHSECFVKGLLSKLERKSIEPIALEYEGQSAVRGMQNFFKDGIWDDYAALKIYQERLSSVISEPTGMINADGSDFPKKGKKSVGVKRQYCGVLGKTENCQAGVFIGYSSNKGYGLIDRELFMPEEWFSDEYQRLRKECGVPEELVFKTKIQIASELIKKAIDSGLFPAQWIGVDSFFGNSKEFLDSIPEGSHYFADIHADRVVFREMPNLVLPEYKGRGRRDLKPKPSILPVTVTSIANDPTIPWNKAVLGEGAKGPIVAEVKRLRVVECSNHLPGDEVWLYIRRYADGKLKFSLSDAPADTEMEILNEVALMRWPIEQCFEECKSYLGLDHYESRSWNAWHRHILFVFIAHLFLQELRLRFKKKILF
jgi:SRSO17 transposase